MLCSVPNIELFLCAAEYGELCDRNRFEAGSSESRRETSHLEIPLESPTIYPLLLAVAFAKGPPVKRLSVVEREYVTGEPYCGCILSMAAVQEASHLLS